MSGYDVDILTWSERQAALLQLHAAGKPSNEAPDGRNIIEEVLDVGLSAVRACRLLLLQALLYRLKVLAWPTSTNVPHWTSEATGALLRRRPPAGWQLTPAKPRETDPARYAAPGCA